MLRQIGANHNLREMSTNEIVAKGLREDLKTRGRFIAKYLATPAAAYEVGRQAKDEYDYQMKNRKKTKYKK